MGKYNLQLEVCWVILEIQSKSSLQTSLYMSKTKTLQKINHNKIVQLQLKQQEKVSRTEQVFKIMNVIYLLRNE